MTQQGSSQAARSTKVRRAQIIEHFTRVISEETPVQFSPSTSTKNKKDVHAQRVGVIRRYKTDYGEAAKEAGLNIVGRFNKETVLALRAMMPLWRRKMQIEYMTEVKGIEGLRKTGRKDALGCLTMTREE